MELVGLDPVDTALLRESMGLVVVIGLVASDWNPDDEL